GPASETAYDTTRIQTALTACPSGKAVELAPSGTNYAFLIAPINIPSGVGLIVDGGVTVFASRNPADYQTTSTELCGGYGASGNGCTTLIKLNNNGTSSNNGIYGYGIIDGRGGSTLLKNGVDSRISWWTNADQAHTAGMSQDNPIILKSSHANNFTLYKITFRNSPVFHVGWGGAGFTAWGVKISSPFTAHNTDGIDPSGSNVTIINASISNGDDNIAVGAGSTSANITISNINTYSGHGISVGSYTSSGLNNMLVQNVNMAGTASDSNATGLRLKSAADRGGLLNTITYKNICLRDTHYPIMLDPFYNTNSGTLLPQFQNIVYQNVHVLAPTGTKYPYLLQLQGYDANHISTVTFNNVVFDQLLLANVKPAPQDITIALAGNVYPAFLQTLTGTGVSYTGSATSTATGGVSTCANVFPYIVGELYLSTASATNLQTATISTGGSVTLNAMVEPAMSQTSFSGTVGSWTGVSAPSASINFYEGATLVGSAALGANGTLAP
ncbi:MAG: glycosyl hydrolase family 28 protein, partial [Acidobacteriaceae bacterium]|nr:glycosyl hydrolase family 28 protein [Acidobacteriaceae bacterium]